MRILHVINGFNMGGAEALVKNYLLVMQEEGEDCKTLNFIRFHTPYEAELAEAGINIINLEDTMPTWALRSRRHGKILWYIYVFFGFRRIIQKVKPDVIHTHLEVNSMVYFALGRKPFYGVSGKKAAFIHTVHNEPTEIWLNTRRPLFERIQRKLELQATKALIQYHNLRFVALHEKMRQELNKMFCVDNTIVINNGIDFNRFKNLKGKETVRQALRIPADAFVIGHVGRFTEQKNHQKLINVFEQVRKQNSNAFLLMIGKGKMVEQISIMLREKNLQECTLILSDREDIPDLMNAMDLFLFPSIFEGLGIALIEAQIMKLPCVVSDKIPQAAIISNMVKTVRLNDNNTIWAKAVLSVFPNVIKYDHIEEWDIHFSVHELLKLYGEELDALI